jgi:hypothetical protein
MITARFLQGCRAPENLDPVDQSREGTREVEVNALDYPYFIPAERYTIGPIGFAPYPHAYTIYLYHNACLYYPADF